MLDVPSRHRTRPKLFSQFPLANPVVQNRSPCAFVQYTVCRVYLGHAMVASQSAGKGVRSGRTARSEPQRDWNSFSPATTIPKDVEGTILSPAEKTRSSHGTTEAEKFIQEREMERAPSSQQQLPRRRGRPRKNEEIMKAQIAEEPCVRLIAEELLRRAIRLEPAGKSSHEGGNRARKVDAMGENEEAPSQQLKQEKMAIVELYQENRELRRQLATKTAEASAAQSHGGNVAWMKRQLREAQNVIVQLREVQRFGRRKAHRASQRMRSSRKGNLCGSCQRTERESLTGDIFFMTVLSDTCPLKYPTILIMVVRIKQLFTAHSSPANGRITEGEANITDNKLLQTPVH
jgi:hypothetical protein